MATAVKLKMINTERIREELKTLDTYTKNTLAAATGLSVATCGNILAEMLDAGEVFEAEQAESTGGRPSRQFVYNKNYAYILTLYLRQEKNNRSIFYAVSNLAGEIVYEKLDEYSHFDVAAVDEIIDCMAVKYPKIKVLAVGVPGVVKDGYVGICDCSIFSGFNVKEYYESKYDFDVVVINDVNCIAYGYYSKSKLDTNDNLAYVYYPLNDGPGAGIIINGKVLLGESNFAGEVAYLPHHILKDNSKSTDFNELSFAESVFRTILTINSIINPKIVVLSGFEFSEKIVFDIKTLLEKYIPKSHIPEIEFEEDIHQNYIKGLISTALKKLTYDFKI